MRGLLTLVATASATSCYAPTVPAGARCEPALDNCPVGQHCTASNGGFACLPRWWDSAWAYRRPIEIDNAKLLAPVADLPVLVTLTGSAMHANVAPNGADLRFVLEDNRGTYFHEIDTYAPTGTTRIWLRIPSLMNSGPKPKLWMYYGNGSAATTSSGAMVFGPTFTSVHHMGATFADASDHGHDAVTPSIASTPAVDPDGLIGGARNFDGADDYLELPNEGDFDFGTSLAASAWVRIDGFDIDYQAIMTKGDRSWRMQRASTTRFAQFGTNSLENLNGQTNVDDNAWHHIAITYDGSTKRLFVDGAEDAAVAYTSTLANVAFPVRFGMNPESMMSGGPRYWNGLIDEVRIGLAKSAAWIAAEHTMVTDAAFVTVGAEEPL